MDVLKPFKIISTFRIIFLIWFVTLMFFSNLGIILSFIINNDFGYNEILIRNLDQGNLYNISIALSASFLAIIVIDIITDNMKSKEINFLTLKMGSLAGIIILIVIMAIFYTLTFVQNTTEKIDYIQILIYVISIISIVYLFCITHLDLDYSSYTQLEDKKLNDLKESANSVSDDGRGNEL